MIHSTNFPTNYQLNLYYGTNQQRNKTDTDHLGSYCALTSPSKRVVQRNYFDPWGNFQLISKGRGIDPGTGVPHVAPTINFTLTTRGFTGHEHYPDFKIINMNGRLYDPVIARFFSPDQYVANSSFTQDFNRYSYARNNPLMYTDPSGHKLKWWGWLAIGLGIDMLTGGMISASAITMATSTVGLAGATATSTIGLGVATAGFAVATGVATYTAAVATATAGCATLSGVDLIASLGKSIFTDDQQALNNWIGLTMCQIGSPIASLGSFDKSAGGGGLVLQAFNYLTGGEILQDFMGKSFAHMQNIGGFVDAVGYYEGRTIIRLKDDYIAKKHIRGISFGHYIFGKGIAFSPYDMSQGPEGLSLFAHEYSYTYQSRHSGPLYLFLYGIPSAAGDIDSRPEVDANWRAFYNFGINPFGRLDLSKYGHRWPW
jgi:RHS repeat-associated protein